MKFDSHIYRLTTAAAGLVNALTPGVAGGRAYPVPSGHNRRDLVAAALALEDGTRPRVTTEQAEEFVQAAAVLRAVFEHVQHGDPATAASSVNQLVRSTGAHPQVDYHPGDGWNVHFHGADDSLVTGWLAGCASGLALAVGSDFAGRLGVCEATRCDRVYVDASRNGAKRFCSTACQSRAKAAAFRVRHR
ncbi:MAG: CGNR zinc finger domain-containing protein [Nocardioidaceae bacterium]